MGRLDDDPLLAKVAPRLAPNGIFVWEHFAKQQLNEPKTWQILRHRIYGERVLTFLQFLRENS